MLKNRENNTELLAKKEVESFDDKLAVLGGTFEDITPEEAKNIGVRGGVKVKKLREGILSKQTEMRSGFIITKVNNHPVYSVKELEDLLGGYTGEGILVEGRYPDHKTPEYYAFGM